MPLQDFIFVTFLHCCLISGNLYHSVSSYCPVTMSATTSPPWKGVLFQGFGTGNGILLYHIDMPIIVF